MRTLICSDCKASVTCPEPCDYRGHSHWGLYAATVRCADCTTTWEAHVRAVRSDQRQARLAEIRAHQAKWELDGHCPDDGVLCAECCPHDDLDHGICMECETDLTDSLASNAYDRAKDARYG